MVLLEIGLGAVVSCVGGALLLFYVFPNKMLHLIMRSRYLSAGMNIKYVTVRGEDFTFCYAEKNKPIPGKTSVVFLHGFTASKDMWIECFKRLPTNIHLLAVDLPGHGGTQVPPSDVVPDMDYAVDRINAFLDSVGLSDKKVHLIGASLGGAMAALFTSRCPDRIEKVTLICPAMGTPIEREFYTKMKDTAKKDMDSITCDDCALLPNDLQGIKDMFDLCTYNKVADKVHDQIWKGVLMDRKTQNIFLLRLFKNLVKPDYLNIVYDIAPKISVPSQVIWGEEDELFHVSGAEHLQARLPDCRRVDIIEKAGHAIAVDRPGGYCKAIVGFIEDDMAEMIEKDDRESFICKKSRI